MRAGDSPVLWYNVGMKRLGKQSSLPVVLVLLNIVFPSLRLELNGLRRFSRMRGWRLKCIRLRPRVGDGEICRIVDEVRPDGVIASLDRPLPDSVTRSLPAVWFDCDPGLVGNETPCINHDARETARLAVRELFRSGCSSYAFMRAEGRWYWSDDRESAFSAEVLRRGGRLAAPFCPPGRVRRAHSIGGGVSFRRALRTWVRSLDKRCGIFAANDALARVLLDVCGEAGVEVPRDVAVVGVDNDSQICTRCTPALTSVVPDWEMGAFMAAETLDMMMRGRRVPKKREFRPLGIVVRGSTKRIRARMDFRVDLAVDLIRRKACEGLKASDVVCKMGCSRRLAEMRFRETTGASMQEAIRDVRLQNARYLLEHTTLPIEVVAKRSGWRSVPTFCRDFRFATDVSPGEYRKSLCAKR